MNYVFNKIHNLYHLATRTPVVWSFVVVVVLFNFMPQLSTNNVTGQLALRVSVPQVEAAWYGTNYQYCRALTINNAQVATTTTGGFALFFSTTTDSLKATSSAGKVEKLDSNGLPIDVIFTGGSDCNSAGSLLDFYHESYASTTGQLDSWIEVMDLSSTTDKTVLMYYGNSSATDLSDEAGTYGAMGEVFVFDFADDPSSTCINNDALCDSMGNYNASSTGSMTSTDLLDGKVGKSIDLDGSDDGFTLGTTNGVSISAGTALWWNKIKATSTTDEPILNKGLAGGNSNDAVFAIRRTDDVTHGDKYRLYAKNASLNGSVFTKDAWEHQAWLFGTGGKAQYTDGAFVTSDSNTGGFTRTGYPFTIGTDNAGTQHLNAEFDDLRVYDQRLTASDIKTIYNNTNDPGSFWTMGTEQQNHVVSWNATDWKLYDTITIDATQIDDDLTDFPVYIDLSDLSSRFWNTTPSASSTVGTDIRVTNLSNTELPRELVYASSTLQTGELHFKADSISSTTDTVFRIWYNGTTTGDYGVTDTYGAENVWTNDFVAVYHLNEDPGTAGANEILDSTSNNLHGTDNGSMTSADKVAGQTGYAIDFDGSDDYLSMGSSALFDLSAGTVAAWYRPDDLNTHNTVWDKSLGANNGGGYYQTVLASAGTNGRKARLWNYPAGATLYGTTLHATSAWAYGAVTFNGSNNKEIFYNGVSENSNTGNHALTLTTADFAIGANNTAGTPGDYFQGPIDELRVSSTTRADAWIKATYENQSTTTDFYTAQYGAGVVITGTLYENDGVTPIARIATITAAVGTSTASVHSALTAPDGSYSISGIATSSGGTSWSSGTISGPFSNFSGSLAYGNGIFVAIMPDFPLESKAFYSYDGITWYEGSGADGSKTFNDVVYGAGRFLAVGREGSGMYSFDGINWATTSVASTTDECSGITYGNGRFVAVKHFASPSEGDVVYSDDGETWATSSAILLGGGFNAITYGDDTFVAVSQTFGIVYSSDGVNWSSATGGGSYQWNDVAYGDGKFVAVSNDGGAKYSTTSGATWVEITDTVFDTKQWNAVEYANGRFVAVGRNLGSSVIAYSDDAINWTTATDVSSSEKLDIVYGQGKFAVLGDGDMTYSDAGFGEDTPITLWVDENATTSSSTASTFTYGINNSSGTTTLHADLYADTVYVTKPHGDSTFVISDGGFYGYYQDTDILMSATTTSAIYVNADLLINASTTVLAPQRLYVDGDFDNQGTLHAERGQLIADATAYDFADARLTYASPNDTGTARGLDVVNNGTKMYWVDITGANNNIKEYDLTVPYDLSTFSYVQATNTAAITGDAVGLEFSTDGTKFFLADGYDEIIYEFTLSTPWDVSTAALSNSSSTAEDIQNEPGLAISPDGTRLYTTSPTSNPDGVIQYSLTTPWDITTLTYVATQGMPAGFDNNIGDIELTTNGQYILATDNTNPTLDWGELSTPWDITTVTYGGNIVSPQDLDAGVDIHPNGSALYLQDGNDVEEYALDTATQYFTGNFSATSSLWDLTIGDTATVSPAAVTEVDNDYHVGGSAAGPHASLVELTGTSTLSGTGNFGFVEVQNEASAVSGAGTFADLTINSGATFFSPRENLTITGDFTNDGAFYNSGATTTFGGQGTYGGVLAFETATTVAELNGDDLLEVAFSTDGSLMYVGRGNGGGGEVLQYLLSTPWDVSTASYQQATSVNAYEGSPNPTFSYDGRYMYTVDSELQQYRLTTPWDVSTAVYMQATTSPASSRSVTIGKDGKNVVTFDGSGDDLHFYELTTPWDVSTMVARGSLNVGSPDGGVVAPDGITVFTVDVTDDLVREYRLNAPWDYTADTLIRTYNISAQEGDAWDISLSSDGTKLYVGGRLTDTITQYDIFAQIATSTGSTSALHDVYFSGGRSVFMGPASTTDLTIGANATVTTHSTEALTVAGDFENNGVFDNATGTLTMGPALGRAIYEGTFNYSSSTGWGNFHNLHFSPDGTKLFRTHLTSSTLYGYTLTTPWDLNTLSNFGSPTTLVFPSGGAEVVFKPDGTRLYASVTAGGGYYVYDLATAWDLTTATLSYISLNDPAMHAYGSSFSPDGKYFYTAERNTPAATVFTIELSTPWDISTSSVKATSSYSTLIDAEDGNLEAIGFNRDGTIFYMTGRDDECIDEFNLSTPWDVSASSISHPNVGLCYGSYVNVTARDFYIRPDGQQVFVVEEDGDIHVFDIPQRRQLLSGTLTGTGAIGDVEITGDTHTVFGASASTSDLTLTNGTTTLPEGMLSVAGDFVNNAHFYSGGGTVYLTGSQNGIDGDLTGIDSSFYNLYVTGTYVASTSASTTNNFTVGTGGAFTATTGQMTIGGDYKNNGTFTNNNGTVVFGPTEGWDLSTATVTPDTLNISTYETSPQEVQFSIDGTKLYTIGGSNNINEFALSTAFDITTASHTASFAVGATNNWNLIISADGRSFYNGSANGYIQKNHMDTPWDLSTAQYSGTDNRWNPPEIGPMRHMSFSADGTRFFVGEHNVGIYDLSEPWNVSSSTVTYVGSYDFIAEDNDVNGMRFNADGTKVYVVGRQSDNIHEYDLSTPWDISTSSVTYTKKRLVLNNLQPRGMDFSADGTKIVVNTNASGLLETYDMSLVPQVVYGTTTGSSAFGDVVVTGDKLTTFATNASTSDLTFNGGTTTLPKGQLSVAGDFVNNADFTHGGGTVYLTGSQNGLDGDFTGYDASLYNAIVTGAYVASTTASTTNLTIASGGTLTATSGDMSIAGDYTNNGTFTHNLGTVITGPGEGWDMSTAVHSNTSSNLLGQDSGPRGITFSSDGLQMYMVGDNGNEINEYTLTTPWDPDSRTFSDVYGVGGEMIGPQTAVLSPDGRYVYVGGGPGANIVRYTLDVPYDLSTLGDSDGYQSYTTAETAYIYGLAFSPDGTSLYAVETGNANILTYTLSTPWDISTSSISYTRQYNIAAEDTQPQDLAFNPDGTKLYVLARTGKDVEVYSLATPWEVSTSSITYDGSARDLSVVTGVPRGFDANHNGTEFFVLAGGGDGQIYTFSLDQSEQTATGTMTGSSAFSNLTQRGEGQLIFGAGASTTGTYTIEPGVASSSGATTTVFQAGATYTFQNIDWRGASSSEELVLRSSASGTQWILDVPGSQLNVEYINVQDGDASLTSGGITAATSSDSGNNCNWDFGSGLVTCGGDAWNNVDWTEYDVITIDHNYVFDNLYDFPVYVDLADLSAAFWSTIRDGGGDIRVTTDNGSPVELAREVVSASTTLQTGELHFKADYLNPGKDTSFRIYYNGVDTEYAKGQTYGRNAVWSNGYEMVYHLNENPGSVGSEGIVDATGRHNGTDNGAMDSNDTVSGVMGQSMSFDGSNDYIELDVYNYNSAPLTISAWSKTTASTTYMSFAGQSSCGGGCTQRLVYGEDGNGSIGTVLHDGASFLSSGDATKNWADGSWVYAVGVFDATNLTHYTNGVATTSVTHDNTWPTTGLAWYIGAHNNASEFFSGEVDEVRVASSSRSSGWIKTEYYNQSTTTLFYRLTSGTGSTTLANHDAGQVNSAFTYKNQTNEVLYAFKLTPETGNATVTQVAIDIDGAHKIAVSDFSNIRLMRDHDSDGVYDASDEAVDSSGTMVIDSGHRNQAGTITFDTDFLATTSQNFIVVADWNAPSRGAQFVLSLAKENVLMRDSAGAVEVFGTADSIQHNRNNRGGGGSAAAVGPAAPAGDGDVGGGTNEGGELIGSDPDFYWPTAHSGTWSSGGNAYDQVDGTYASDNTGVTNDFSTFNDSVPGSDAIQGVEVKLEVSGTTAAGSIGVELSWDGGSSYTTSGYTTGTLTSTDTVVTLGGPSDTWGRGAGAWQPSHFSNANFRVRVTGAPSSNTVQIDAIQVKVYHQATGGGSGGGGAI